jgi:hypothetical protein
MQSCIYNLKTTLVEMDVQVGSNNQKGPKKRRGGDNMGQL